MWWSNNHLVDFFVAILVSSSCSSAGVRGRLELAIGNSRWYIGMLLRWPALGVRLRPPTLPPTVPDRGLVLGLGTMPIVSGVLTVPPTRRLSTLAAGRIIDAGNVAERAGARSPGVRDRVGVVVTSWTAVASATSSSRIFRLVLRDVPKYSAFHSSKSRVDQLGRMGRAPYGRWLLLTWLYMLARLAARVR